ncbi:MAG: S1C family serine protease [Planctomycetota bacterium]
MPRFRTPPAGVTAAFALLLFPAFVAADEPAAHDKPAPESLDDLLAIQARVEAVTDQTAAATVSLDLGFFGGSGSGVVIGDEGYILTAAHVIGDPGNVIQVRFPDGTVQTAETLGSDQTSDAGLAKLQGDGPWPSVEMADPGSVEPGDWVVSLGHPGGYDPDRNVVVRLGRILRIRQLIIQSDCSLIGGDSGGPLFNLDGQVIGIHSRIGTSERLNMHIPIAVYHEVWDQLIDSERWGRPIESGAFLGFYFAPDPQGRGVVVDRVMRRSAAAKAGIKRRDIITRIADQPVRDEDGLREIMALEQPGEQVTVTVIRGGKELQLDVTPGKDPR